MAKPLTDIARELHGRSTEAEARLWFHLRAHRFDALKFRRQQPIGQYVVDFVCHDLKLIVEADGSQHLESAAVAARDAWLKSQGFSVLRFWNDDILLRADSVLEAILYASKAPSLPASLPRGERGEVHEDH